MEQGVSAMHRPTMSLNILNSQNSSYLALSNSRENFQKRYIDRSFLQSLHKSGALRHNSEVSSSFAKNLPEGIYLKHSTISVSTSNHAVPLKYS